MEPKRLAGSVTVAALALLAGGCAVYSTPSGDVIGPAPLVVSPPAVFISPWGYAPRYRAPRSYGGPRQYWGPRHFSGPRYYRDYGDYRDYRGRPRGYGPAYRHR